MALRFFRVPILDPNEAEVELNGFLGGHRVVSVERRFVDLGHESFWAVCVDFIVGASARSAPFGPKERVDYKEKLTPEQFEVFSKLRDLRKEVAREEAIPVYTVFSNDQLARMVVERVVTKAELEKVDGVGEARAAKYGARFLELLVSLPSVKNEASGAAV